MTTELDLTERLNRAAAILDRHPCEVVWLARDCRLAADEITRLRRQVQTFQKLACG